MNAKKIIRGVMGLGTIAGVAYLAFKLGESNGEVNERFREKDDDEDSYNLYDEPDDKCLALSDSIKK